MLRPAFPDGHFYSPVIDPDEVYLARQRIWPDKPQNPYGIDLRPDSQRELLRSLSAVAKEFDYPETAPRPHVVQFYERNGKFEGLDARILFCLIRHLRPKRVIEVGSGFSSSLDRRCQ